MNEGNSQIHFGWGRVSLLGTPNGVGRALVEYAYESNPGVGIGAGAIPEPGTFAALAMGAVGLLARRRRTV